MVIRFMVLQLLSPYRILRGYLGLNGFINQKHQGANGLPNGISYRFLDGKGDESYSYRRVATLITLSQNPSVIDNSFDGQYESTHKISHNSPQRFEKEEHFTGQVNDDIHEYFDNCENAENNYVLGNMQRFKYLHNLFDRELIKVTVAVKSRENLLTTLRPRK